MTSLAHCSIDEAAEALSRLVPSTRVGDPILRALTAAIEIAHEIAPLSWSLTLSRKLVRLNFGPVEVFLLAGDHAWFPVMISKPPPVEGIDFEAPRHKWLQPAHLAVGSHTSIASYFAKEGKPAFLLTLGNVRVHFKTETFLNGGAKKAHTPALLDYLEQRLNHSLPRPGWQPPPFDIREVVLAEELVGFEGERRLYTHFKAERSQAVVNDAKARWRAKDPMLSCEVCGFSSERQYGLSYTEAHHRVPISTLVGNTPTTARDLACVCANCHRALHLDSKLTVELLRTRLQRGRQ